MIICLKHRSLNKMYARVQKLCLSCLQLYLASLPRKIPGTQYQYYFERKRCRMKGKQRVEKKEVQSCSYKPYSKSKTGRESRTDP